MKFRKQVADCLTGRQLCTLGEACVVYKVPISNYKPQQLIEHFLYSQVKTFSPCQYFSPAFSLWHMCIKMFKNSQKSSKISASFKWNRRGIMRESHSRFRKASTDLSCFYPRTEPSFASFWNKINLCEAENPIKHIHFPPCFGFTVIYLDLFLHNRQMDFM